MKRATECAIDTTVLQKTNAPITQPRAGPQFRRRMTLLGRISDGEIVVLISSKLLQEYQRQIPLPRNDAIKLFFELLSSARSDRVVWSWKPRWSGADREKARDCRFPAEDDHVLRTAIRPRPSFIITEEYRMLTADDCIYRAFGVHIQEP